VRAGGPLARCISNPRKSAPEGVVMQNLLIGIAAAMAAVQPSPIAGPLTRSESVMVRTVVDGDTIDVASIGRVRLLGIDAPELAHGFDTAAPFAREARERLAALVLKRWVRLEQDGPSLDVYGRHLAYVVRDDGLFVNAVLVREGLARISARQPLTRLAELERAEAEAQAFRRGMWGQAPEIPSTGYTHGSDGARSPSVKSRQARKLRPKSQKPKT
jgi:micrococcal nuclease